MLRIALLGAAASLALGVGIASAQDPMPAAGAPTAAGNTTTPSDRLGFTPTVPNTSEAEVVNGASQPQTGTVMVGAAQTTIVSSTPVPNPPPGTSSSSPGRGAGRVVPGRGSTATR